MYKDLMFNYGFSMHDVDEMDIKWFFSILEVDESETASSPKMVPIDAVF